MVCIRDVATISADDFVLRQIFEVELAVGFWVQVPEFAEQLLPTRGEILHGQSRVTVRGNIPVKRLRDAYAGTPRATDGWK